MTKKIVDLMAYRIEKAMKENGFTVKMDGDSRVKLVIKLNSEQTAE